MVLRHTDATPAAGEAGANIRAQLKSRACSLRVVQVGARAGLHGATVSWDPPRKESGKRNMHVEKALHPLPTMYVQDTPNIPQIYPLYFNMQFPRVFGVFMHLPAAV